MEPRKYVIAGLKVLMRCTEEHMLKQGDAYLCDFEGDADIVIDIPHDQIERIRLKHPPLTYDEMEYLLTGSRFYYKFIQFNGMMLHSSCVVVDETAYLFSAPSGTGKSTHTALWLKNLGDRAFILNDDKPALRIEDGVFYAYGTPWSGKTDQNINAKYRIGGIAFIERSNRCFIEDMPTTEAIKNLYWQTVKPRIEANVDILFKTCEDLINSIPIYRFGANISDEAFRTSYEKMTGNKFRVVKGEDLYV